MQLKEFKKAKIKLTSFYLIVIMVITLGFSTLVYFGTVAITNRALQNQENRLNRRMEVGMGPAFNRIPQSLQKDLREETVLQIRRDLFISLLFINSFILLASGLGGYYLAGRTLKPIEIMYAKQKKFASDAAHEFKTPLTAIQTLLEVYERSSSFNVADYKKVLKELLEEVDNMKTLFKFLIEESKDVTSSVSIYEVNLNDVVQKVIKLNKVPINTKKVHINTNFKLRFDHYKLRISPQNLTRLLNIFVDNAIKFSTENSAIDLTVKDLGKLIEIKVIDNGIGIKKEHIPYIFDRFYKASSSRTRNTNSGFGLGLSIAKEIAEVSNIDLEAESEKRNGTTFTIKIHIEK